MSEDPPPPPAPRPPPDPAVLERAERVNNDLMKFVREDGEFDVVWHGPHMVRADPYLVAYDRSIGQRVPV